MDTATAEQARMASLLCRALGRACQEPYALRSDIMSEVAVGRCEPRADCLMHQAQSSLGESLICPALSSGR